MWPIALLWNNRTQSLRTPRRTAEDWGRFRQLVWTATTIPWSLQLDRDGSRILVLLGHNAAWLGVSPRLRKSKNLIFRLSLTMKAFLRNVANHWPSGTPKTILILSNTDMKYENLWKTFCPPYGTWQQTQVQSCESEVLPLAAAEHNLAYSNNTARWLWATVPVDSKLEESSLM